MHRTCLITFAALIAYAVAPTLARQCDPEWTDEFAYTGLQSTGSLIVFNDGSGPALYASGRPKVDGEWGDYVARWNGTRWDPVGGGVKGSADPMVVFDDGSGPALYVGGGFTSAGSTSANRIARWDGSEWSPLGKGFDDGSVYALVVFDDGRGPALYAGGNFTKSGGRAVNRVARWNGSEWTPLGSGITGHSQNVVMALAVFDDGSGPALYAGGEFEVEDHAPTDYIARWDGAAWQPVGGGLQGEPFTGNNGVRAMAVYDDGRGPALYVGGKILGADGAPVHYIARWDGAAWSDVGGGTYYDVNTLYTHDDGTGPALFASGGFVVAGGVRVNFIARWDGTAWSALGDGLGSQAGAMATFDDGTGPALYVTGGFDRAGAVPASGFARWDGEWSAFGRGVEYFVEALAEFNDGSGPALYAGGWFDSAGTTFANRVARFDGTEWRPLGSGLDSIVYALGVFDDGQGKALYAGGDFSDFNFIARWDGKNWSGLSGGMDGWVYALLPFDDGSGPALYAGGMFGRADGIWSPQVARWDGAEWSAVGSGLSGGYGVLDLAVFDDGRGPALYAAGDFEAAGQVIVNGVARWNGSSWSPVGRGLGPGARVRALAVFDDGSGPALFAGGRLTIPGRPMAETVARWDGSSWSVLGAGMTAGTYYTRINTLAVFDEGPGPALYAAGAFTQADGVAANNIARWNGTAWEPLGRGVNETVFTLGSFDVGSGPALYAGGVFRAAGDFSSEHIARWGCAHASCRPDCTADRKLTINDFICFQSQWRKKTAYADYNRDGAYTVNDFLAFQSDWKRGCR